MIVDGKCSNSTFMCLIAWKIKRLENVLFCVRMKYFCDFFPGWFLQTLRIFCRHNDDENRMNQKAAEEKKKKQKRTNFGFSIVFFSLLFFFFDLEFVAFGEIFVSQHS